MSTGSSRPNEGSKDDAPPPYRPSLTIGFQALPFELRNTIYQMIRAEEESGSVEFCKTGQKLRTY
jgi:hypothetical protein